MSSLKAPWSGTAGFRTFSLQSRLNLATLTLNTFSFSVSENFCVQVINNACATQAIISVLLNVSHQDMDLGSVLTEFKEFSGPLDPSVSENIGEIL